MPRGVRSPRRPPRFGRGELDLHAEPTSVVEVRPLEHPVALDVGGLVTFASDPAICPTTDRTPDTPSPHRVRVTRWRTTASPRTRAAPIRRHAFQCEMPY